MTGDVLRMEAPSALPDGVSPPEKLEWEGREVVPHYVSYKVYEEAEKGSMSAQDKLLHTLWNSLHHADDGTKVFKTRAEISEIPNVKMYRIWKLAMACATFNKPPESENPFPKD